MTREKQTTPNDGVLTELDVLRMEHLLLTEMSLAAATGADEVRDALMMSAGINAMAQELLKLVWEGEADETCRTAD